MAELPSLHDPVTYIVTGPKDQRGPYTLDLICNELLAGRLSNDMLIWWPGMADWVKVKDHDALQAELERRRGQSAVTAPAPPQHAQPDHAPTQQAAPPQGNVPFDSQTAAAPGWASPQQDTGVTQTWSAADLPVAESSPDTILDARVVGESPAAGPSNGDALKTGHVFGHDPNHNADNTQTRSEPDNQEDSGEAEDFIEAEIVDDSTDDSSADDPESWSKDDDVEDAQIVEAVGESSVAENGPTTDVSAAGSPLDAAVTKAVTSLIDRTEDLYRRREHRRVIQEERRNAALQAATALGWKLTRDELTSTQQELEFEKPDGQRLRLAMELLAPREVVGDEDFAFVATITAPREDSRQADNATVAGRATAREPRSSSYGEIVANVDDWTGSQTFSLELILDLATYVNINSASNAVTVDTTALQTDVGHIIAYLESGVLKGAHSLIL